MKDVLQACMPRPEILSGQFNPEIFKASLSRVLEDYGNGRARPGAASIYSDPVAFFRDATYPTQGMKDIINNVLARLTQGDLSRPAMQRLDTAFGGGKTHTQIALIHAALSGKAIDEHARTVVDPGLLPNPGDIRVIGIVGDTVDTIREETNAQGHPKPNTLWWMIALQALSEGERAPIANRLEEGSAPASDDFFNHLFGDRPTLIVIDEIAQYLARMEAAFPERGAQQSAAFMMSLATYAEDRANIAVVLSLASATNAFGDYNKLIRSLQDTHGLGRADAESMVESAQGGLRDVVERSSAGITPVQQGDLSKIMAKRLFVRVDQDTAEEVADAFVRTYQLAGADLPTGANHPRLRETLIAHYPFHPRLIEFLSQDLAQVEEFQGTRGLLRTLARAVRRIWDAKLKIALIQTGHIDLSDNTIRTELLGKTGNSDLRTVLDADVTKPSDSNRTGNTIAEDLDQENPHPDGFPVTEWAWRVVFLHSLVGRAGGLKDEKFGIDIGSAVFEMASPAIPPATIRSTLEAIAREANYLRERDGRLYADTKPTLNNLLRRIETSVHDDDIMVRIDQVVRGLISNDLFEVRANVSSSEDIPDKVTKPQLGVLAFQVPKFDPAEFIEKRGDVPRECQNLVFLLAPSTAHIEGQVWSESRTQQEARTRNRLFALARKALAAERLSANPDSWGVDPEQLRQTEFREYRGRIPKDLETAVQETYRMLVFPGKDGGRPVVRDLNKGGGGPTAGGSAGLHLEDSIRQQLAQEGELITRERAVTSETINLLGKLFFQSKMQVSVGEIERQFQVRRNWPILQYPALLSEIIRAGADKSAWCLGFMPDRDAHKPEGLYHKDNPVPINKDLLETGWFICTKDHAKQLGWLENIVRDPDTVANWIIDTLEAHMEMEVGNAVGAVESSHDKVDPNVFFEQVDNLLASKKMVAYPNDAFDEDGKPDAEAAIFGADVPIGGVRDMDVRIVPYHVAQERGWIVAPRVEVQVFDLVEETKIGNLLNVLAGTALKDSKTEVRQIRIRGFLSDQSNFDVSMQNTTVGALVGARDIFAAIKTKGRFGLGARVRVEIGEMDPQCKFVEILKTLR